MYICTIFKFLKSNYMEKTAKISQYLIKFIANYRPDANGYKHLQTCIASIHTQQSEYMRTKQFLTCLGDETMLKFFEKTFKNYYSENKNSENPESYDYYIGNIFSEFIEKCGSKPITNKGTIQAVASDQVCVVNSLLEFVGEEKIIQEDASVEKSEQITAETQKSSNKKRIITGIIIAIVLIGTFLGIRHYKNKKNAISDE